MGSVHVDVCSRDPRHGEGLGPRLLGVEHRGAAHDRRTAALGRALLPHLTARPPPGAGSRRARPVRRAQQHRPDLHHRLGREAARELGRPGVGGGRSRGDARVVRSHRRDTCGRDPACAPQAAGRDRGDHQRGRGAADHQGAHRTAAAGRACSRCTATTGSTTRGSRSRSMLRTRAPSPTSEEPLPRQIPAAPTRPSTSRSRPRASTRSSRRTTTTARS